MSQEELEEQRRALEEAFFAREGSEAHVAKLRMAELEEAALETLAAASGISDEALLRKLSGVGIRAETLAALTLVPLIEVAWSDGVMDAREKRAVLAGATSTGMTEDSPSYALLELWIDDRPAPGMFKLWGEYIGSLCRDLSDDEIDHFRDNILRRARDVAEAAGSFLGFGNNISRDEGALLSELKSRFRSSG